MSCIVCATRGGEGSRAAQKLAIRRAQEEDSRLAFLYIADKDATLDHDSSLDVAIEKELLWLGRVILNVAQERASRAGLLASTHVSFGSVRAEIVRYVKEQSAHVLILGAPRNTTVTVFGDDAIEMFAAEIQELCGAQVEIARPEDI